MIKRPIDSFVDYFLDVKPYHTKILEIIEQYRFTDIVNVGIADSIKMIETFANDPLCAGIGYGLEFDDDSGYSGISNCHLFNCTGGYGLVFDNSDVLVDVPIETIDEDAGTVTVDGDYRYDGYYQILSTSASTITIAGNVVGDFANYMLFMVIPKNKYLINETAANGFYVNGNHLDQFINKGQFGVYESSDNDNLYPVTTAKYIQAENRTFIQTNISTLNQAENGFILVDSDTKNNSVYLRTSVDFNGTNTIITLSDQTPIKTTGETHNGVVVLRRALVSPRRVFPANNNTSDWKIADTSYDIVNNRTTLLLEGNIAGVFESTNVQLIGYYVGAGFDQWKECSSAKPTNVNIAFSEFLSITIEGFGYDVPPYLARLNSDGTVDSSFVDLQLDDSVYALDDIPV